MKALFRRVSKVEENQEKIIELLNDHVGFRVEEGGRMFYPVKEKMKEQELLERIVSRDVENAPRVEEEG